MNFVQPIANILMIMKPTLKTLLGSAALTGLLFAAHSTSARASVENDVPQPLIQIGILLDTSGSMKGLIDQAKGQLWKIVNEFIKAKQNGLPPEVHVGLYEYGKSSLESDTGWIREIQPLTTDLDKISEELFALKTNGGDEYCGWVIRDAVTRLDWSHSPDVYKAIFIAGNEPFTQGPVSYFESCRKAIAKGIIVNTIHCGEEGVGIETKWRDGALLADGKYMVIDHNQAVVHFDAPQDKEIAQLSTRLNSTYIPYGERGGSGLSRQTAQDLNASSLVSQGAAVQRALTKASANYSNINWDLVDALQQKVVDLDKLESEDLPEPLKKMNVQERRAYVESKASERTVIQTRIRQLNEARSNYVAEQIKKHTGTNTLDTVIISAIREQAAKKNFQFE